MRPGCVPFSPATKLNLADQRHRCWCASTAIRRVGRRAALSCFTLVVGHRFGGGWPGCAVTLALSRPGWCMGGLAFWLSWGEGRASEAQVACALCCRRFSHVCLVGGKKKNNNNKTLHTDSCCFHWLAPTCTHSLTQGLCMQGSPLIEVRWVVTLT